MQYTRDNKGGQLTERLQYIEQLGTDTDWQDVMMDGKELGDLW